MQSILGIFFDSNDQFQVPNSLPNRNNIEIEIYGMEGIPPEDAKEHERQKAGGALVTGGSDE